MNVSISNPPALHTPLRSYSHLATAPAGGRLVFVAGQVALDESGALVGPEDIELQTEQTLRNVGTALSAGGASWRNVVKLTSYLTAEDHIDGFAEARSRVFTEHFPDDGFPPSVLLVISALARPLYLVEIDAIAIVGEGSG